MFRLSSLFLLGILSQALAQGGPPMGPGGRPLDVPDDARSLPMECQDILFEAGVTNEFKASKAYTDTYHVALKLSTTTKDAADILSLPAMSGVKPTLSYTKDYDVGFVAKLTYQQVCNLDKDRRVSYVAVCDPVECSPDTGPLEVGPPGTAGVVNAPNLAGLSTECGRVYWYILAGLDPKTVVPGEFVAITKVWVPPKDSDALFNKFPGKLPDKEAEAHGVYTGKWTAKEICEIEKSPMVSYVDAQEPLPPGGGGMPPPAKGGPKGGPKGGAKGPKGRN